jgi:hypothetical protein
VYLSQEKSGSGMYLGRLRLLAGTFEKFGLVACLDEGVWSLIQLRNVATQKENSPFACVMPRGPLDVRQ